MCTISFHLLHSQPTTKINFYNNNNKKSFSKENLTIKTSRSPSPPRNRSQTTKRRTQRESHHPKNKKREQEKKKNGAKRFKKVRSFERSKILSHFFGHFLSKKKVSKGASGCPFECPPNEWLQIFFSKLQRTKKNNKLFYFFFLLTKVAFLCNR